jgi:hypothetical protein
MLVWYDGKSLRRITEAEADALYRRGEVDPEPDEGLCAAGARIPARSLDRPRILVKPRPAWLAFLLRTGAAAGRLLRRIWSPGRNGLVQADLEEAELAEIWPTAISDWESVERVGGLRIRPATRSLHRPRRVAKPRPALLAFLLRLVGARG